MNPCGQLELERLPLLNKHRRYERRERKGGKERLQVHQWVREFLNEKVSKEVGDSTRIIYGGKRD